MSRNTLKIKKTDLLGKILLNVITTEKLEIALKEQSAFSKGSPRRLGEILVELGFLAEDDLLEALSSQFGLKYLRFSEFPKSIPNDNYPSVKFMKQYKFVPIGKEEGVLKVALADPLNEYVFDALEVFSDTPMEMYHSSETDITEAI